MGIENKRVLKALLNRAVRKNTPSPAPGSKPSHFGPDVEWDGYRHRWVCPEGGCGSDHTHDSKKPESTVRDAPEKLPTSREESRRRASKQYRESPDIQNVSENRGAYAYYNFEYKGVNEALRNGWELGYEEQEIYEGMKEAMSPLSKDYEVYRGWRNDPSEARVKVGDIFRSDQFTSTTLDSHYAVEWMGYNSSTGEVVRGNPLWRIRVPKGTYGVIPEGVSNDYEVELTIDTSTKFKCVGIQKGEVMIGGPGETVLYAKDIYEMEVIQDE